MMDAAITRLLENKGCQLRATSKRLRLTSVKCFGYSNKRKYLKLDRY